MTRELHGHDMVVAARAIATIAHHGQVDKAGNPYIDHPARVAEAVEGNARDVAVAWLHDVLEDTAVTAEALAAAGMPPSVMADVALLTRKEGQQPEDYYQMIRGTSLGARRVKLADIADNTNVDRLALLDDATIARLTRKYAKARLLLGAT